MKAGWSLGEAFGRLSLQSTINDQLLEFGLNSHGLKYLDDQSVDRLFCKENFGQNYIEYRKKFERRWRILCFSFRTNFERGNFVAFGHAEDLMAPFSFIAPSQWLSLDHFDFRNSTISSRAGAGRYLGVTIFPVVDAPNATTLLAGMKMMNFVQRFVAQDLDLQFRHLDQILSNDVLNAPTFHYMLSGAKPGQILVPIVDDQINITNALLYSPGPLTLAWCSEQLVPGDSKNPEKAKAYFSALAGLSPAGARLASLFRLMIDGAVSLHAIAEGEEGEPVPLPASAFRNPDLRLCLATGDLWEIQDGTPSRRWHSIRIEKPEAVEAEPTQGSRKSTGGAQVGRPPAEYEKAVTSVLRMAFKGVLQISSAKNLAAEVSKEIKKNKPNSKPPADERIKDVLRDQYPEVWNAAKSP